MFVGFDNADRDNCNSQLNLNPAIVMKSTKYWLAGLKNYWLESRFHSPQVFYVFWGM